MSNIIIPSSPADIAKIKGAMQEISNSYSRQESEREFVKEAIMDLADAVDVPKKVLGKMARIFHKQNMAELLGEIEDVEALMEAL
jgi:hypothetical protein|tara:strand:- start:1214 stop:1468 length:255 start_codon:yes stop_codon:yes gene_type:complete